MNILFTAWQEFNPLTGGVERVTSVLAEALIKKGHHVFFAASKPTPHAQSYTPVAEQVFLPNEKDYSSEKNKQFLIDFIKTRKIEIIVCQTTTSKDFTTLCYQAKEATGTKLVYVLHNAPDYRMTRIRDTSYPLLARDKTIQKEYKRITRFLFKRFKIKAKAEKIGHFYRKIYDQGDAFVLLSDAYIPIVRKLIKQEVTPKLFAIFNPVSFDIQKQKEQKQKQVIFVGRLDHQKAPEKALLIWNKVFREHPDWRLDFIGDGPYSKDVQALCRKMKLEHVQFHGFQSPNSFYQKASILILPSRYEGLPMVLIEAMEYGTVPIAFDSYAALQDIITEGETGFRIKPYDINLFAEQLAYLMENEPVREKMSSQCIEAVTKFDLHRIIEEWENLFGKLLN